MSVGTLYGVGLGPGDPELMSVRADRLIREAKHIAFFRKKGRTGQARGIVESILTKDVIEFPMEYPVTTEVHFSDPLYNEILSTFYEDCATHLKDLCMKGHDVVIPCEGDPFFYGSFMHLYERLKNEIPTQVVPAITGMSAAWTATGHPMTWGDDVLSVLMGTLSEEKLVDHLSQSDAVAIMKIGRNIEKVKRALKTANRYEDAWLIEYASMGEQTVQKLSDVGSKVTPYFSIVILHGHGRRP